MDPELKTTMESSWQPEQEQARYRQELEDWNVRCIEIRNIHSQVVQQRIDRRRDELEMDVGRGYDVMARSQDAIIAEAYEQRREALEELNKPGKIKSRRRKELKKIWDESDEKIRGAYEKLAALEVQLQEDMERAINQTQLMEPEFRRAAEAALPYPERPCDPVVKRREEEHRRILRTKDAILSLLKARDGATLNEIAEGVPELEGCGIQQVGEFLRQMWEENAIARAERNGRMCFVAR